MTLARNVGGDLHAIGQAHAGDLADGRVRLAGGLGSYFGAYTALKRRRIVDGAVFKHVKAALECRRLRLVGADFASLTDEL